MHNITSYAYWQLSEQLCVPDTNAHSLQMMMMMMLLSSARIVERRIGGPTKASA